MRRGFTFIEVIVGIALMLIVFLGIFGAYQLGLKVVGLSKNKIVATAIANAQIERIRNLPYEDVGTIGASPSPPFAVGMLESATSTTLNNIRYDIAITIKYIADEVDGLASPVDKCPNDYKRAEVKVSWSGQFGGEVSLISDVAPQNLIQECEVTGGILSVLVFDAYGAIISSPLIEIFHPATTTRIDFATPPDGKYHFPLAFSTYKVVVSKSGYSTERTYGTDEIVTPEKPHPIVLEGQITETSFSIDRLSAFSLYTLSPWGEDLFSDTFFNESKISEKSNVVVSQEKVNLATTTDGYLSSGYLISATTSPENLLRWNEFSFTDDEPPDTDLKYQIYYATDTSWELIPEEDLEGNLEGFNETPVGLSNLDPNVYSKLKLRANFSTNNTTTTPILQDWQISWITSLPTPIPHAQFLLRGEKIIGRDASENPIYKYSTTTNSDALGHKNLLELEWDNYYFSVSTTTGLDLVGTDPSPQPVSLWPNTFSTVKLYLDSQNSLLVTVQNIETLEPVFSAGVRLYKSGYDTTQYTNERGQTYFIPLETGTYSLEIQAAGYSATSTIVSVLGDVTKTIKLEQIE